MFSGFRLNPFPVRLAVQVGCDGIVSGTAARVDAARTGAIRDALAYTELPLSVPPRSRPGTTAILEDAVISDATNTLRKVFVSLMKQRPSEAAVLLMPPFDRVENTRMLTELWSRELRCKVHLFREVDFAADLLRKTSPQRQSVEDAEEEKKADSKTAACDDESANLQACWFAAHAAAAKNLAPQRLLVLREDATDSNDRIEVVGCERGEDTTQRLEFKKWTIPVTTPEAHRMLYADVQHRPDAVYQGPRHSVSPVHRREVAHLSKLLRERIGEPPQWVRDRIASGGVVCGSSLNGFALNTAARVAGAVHVSLEKLEQSTEFHYAGLGDVLLSNFPVPSLVIPQACLVSSLCRSLCCPRIVYLPEASPTHAMLTLSNLWTMHKLSDHHADDADAMSEHELPQTHHAYPHQAIDRFEPNRARW